MREVTPVDTSGKTACLRRDVIITIMDETGILRLQPWECQQVSTYHRVRRICADGGFRAMSVYQKNRELYTSLRKKDWSKEYNVKNLLRLVEKFDGVSNQ